MDNEVRNLIQAVINTLGEVEIKATESNLEKMLGCIQLLGKIRDRKEEIKIEKADSE